MRRWLFNWFHDFLGSWREHLYSAIWEWIFSKIGAAVMIALSSIGAIVGHWLYPVIVIPCIFVALTCVGLGIFGALWSCNHQAIAVGVGLASILFT
jgi:hypothetical protein